LITIAWLLASGPASAGPGEGELFVDYTYRVKPGMSAEFEKVLKEWKASFGKHKAPHQMHVYSDNNFRYEILIPVRSYSGIDELNKVFEALTGKKKWKALQQRELKVSESIRVNVMRHMPGLSYRPKKPRLENKEAQAYLADFLYVQPSKIDRFLQISRKLVQLAEKKQVADGWDFYQGSIGWTGPVFIGIIRGKDHADIRSHNSEMWKQIGKEGSRLYKEVMTLLRRREQREGWHRAELSIPEYR
jgi:hypothetical protein